MSTVDLMEIDSPTMQQEAPHPDPPAPTAPVRQAAKRLTAHELKLKVAGEFQCPRRVLKALPEVLWHLQLDGLVALAPKDLIKVKGIKNWLAGDAPRRVTLDGSRRCSALWDMRLLFEKAPYSLTLLSVIAFRAENGNGWPRGETDTELAPDLKLIHAAVCAELHELGNIPQEMPADDAMKNAPFHAPMLNVGSPAHTQGAQASRLASDAIGTFWDQS